MSKRKVNAAAFTISDQAPAPQPATSRPSGQAPVRARSPDPPAHGDRGSPRRDGRTPRGARTNGIEPHRPVRADGTHARADQTTGKWLEPEPDAGNSLPLHGSPRDGPEVRRG